MTNSLLNSLLKVFQVKSRIGTSSSCLLGKGIISEESKKKFNFHKTGFFN